MKRMKWEITINVPREDVFNKMLKVENYKKWSEPFMAGSYIVGDWKEGSEMRFLVDDENGKPSGMLSRVSELREPEFVSIEHVGWIEKGRVITEGPELEGCAPAFENYTLTKDGDFTHLLVEQDIGPQFEQMFSEAWPKALQKLKELCEE